MKKETVVTIVSDDKPSEETKYPVRPSKRSKGLARRLSFPAIQFYDLAQVNTGTTEAPVYTDHPILKVPGYSISPELASGNFVGARYTIDPFTSTDYQAYTDRMFAVAPVTEWKHYFKKMEALSEPWQFEQLRVRKVPQTGLINTQLIVGTYADIATPSGRADRLAFLSSIGFSWTSRGLEYRNFTELTVKANLGDHEWFSSSTGIKDTYYVTSVYDPNASDVGALTITGNIDVYLMPHIGLFLGASYDGPHVLTGYLGQNGVQVLGPWYQVAPRIDWPSAFIVNPETLTFIDYQRNRADAQASEWFHDGGATTTLTSSTIDPTVFAVGNFTFVTGMLNAGTPVFYNTTARVFYQPSASDFFINPDPFLMAVLKIHGNFYYVWCVPGFVEVEAVSFSGYDITEYTSGIDGPPF